MSDDAKRGSPETNVDARLHVIVVFPGERAFCARLLSDTALLRRQSIDRFLRLSILHNEPPILCLRAERVAVSRSSSLRAGPRLRGIPWWLKSSYPLSF